jgi:hypothetical protein
VSDHEHQQFGCGLTYNFTTSCRIALESRPFDLPALVGPIPNTVAQSSDARPRYASRSRGGPNPIPNLPMLLTSSGLLMTAQLLMDKLLQRIQAVMGTVLRSRRYCCRRRRCRCSYGVVTRSERRVLAKLHVVVILIAIGFKILLILSGLAQKIAEYFGEVMIRL